VSLSSDPQLLATRFGLHGQPTLGFTTVNGISFAFLFSKLLHPGRFSAASRIGWRIPASFSSSRAAWYLLDANAIQ
jgi:hypothetical protein